MVEIFYEAMGARKRVYPIQITVVSPFSGEHLQMTASGIGNYPYDCLAKTRFPDAMIYTAESSWIGSYNELFLKRLTEFDIY